MKIILIKDVRKIGQKGQIIEVTEGYGRNFLIKQGMGKAAVGGVLKDAENKADLKKGVVANQTENELRILSEVNKKRFTLSVNASDKGHLFAAVKKKEIAEASGVHEKNINLKKDIKEIGEFEITVNLGGKKGKIILVVEKR
jgi:large subunit ribosomal protein L9